MCGGFPGLPLCTGSLHVQNRGELTSKDRLISPKGRSGQRCGQRAPGSDSQAMPSPSSSRRCRSLASLPAASCRAWDCAPPVEVSAVPGRVGREVIPPVRK